MGDNPAADSQSKTDDTEIIAADAPLLIFDSGIGGLSILAEIRSALPHAPIVYAADHAFLPYGDKSESEIATRVPALLGRLAERYQPRLVVIACNTACTIALPHIRSALDIPVVGTVPAIKPAAENSRSKVIGLLGTQATIRQSYVDRLHADHAAGCSLIRHAAPDLVHAAEAKLRGEDVYPDIYNAAIAGLTRQEGGDKIDQIVLGCTHFPLVKEELRKASKRDISFVDGAGGIARRVRALTNGQKWPAQQMGGTFLTTGKQAKQTAYKPALVGYGLRHFDTL